MEDYIVRAIVEDVPVGLIVIDESGEVIATNLAASSITGVSREDLVNRPLGELFFAREINSDFNNIIVDTIMNRHVHHHDEVYYTRPDGVRRYLSITSSFLRHGETLGIVILMDDRTEEHECIEREKRLLIERTRLEHERAETLKNFAMSVAHQVRNPLVPIAGYSRRMLDTRDEADTEHGYLVNISEGAARIEHIIDSVGEYSELDTVAPIMVDFMNLYREQKTEIDARSEEDGRSVDWRISIEQDRVYVDPYYFGIVLRELFRNAYEAYPAKHRDVIVDIQLIPDGDHVELRISDYGTGFSPEHRPYLFDAFFTTKLRNTGMGLAKVLRIVQEHKGTVDITLTDDTTTTIVRLPRTP